LTTIILCASFIRVTNCSIRVSWSFMGRLQSPCPLGCYTYMIVSHTACPTYVFIVWKEDVSLPAMFNLLCSSTNQQLFKKNFCNQSSHYKNYGRIIGSHNVPTTKLTLFVVNKDEWYTKEAMLSPWRTHCMYSGAPRRTVKKSGP